MQSQKPQSVRWTNRAESQRRSLPPISLSTNFQGIPPGYIDHVPNLIGIKLFGGKKDAEKSVGPPSVDTPFFWAQTYEQVG